MFTFSSNKLDTKNKLATFFEIVFIRSFTTNSASFRKFYAGNLILFQINVFGKYIKETLLTRYFIKVTAHPSFARSSVIRQINSFP